MSTETTTAISLTKGQKVDLTKTHPGLTLIAVGLGWDVNAGSGDKFDLDAVAIMLRNGKFADTKDLIYFNNLNSTCGSVKHSGDNLTGAGDGDDEIIGIDLSKVPADVDAIIVAVNIYEAQNRRQTFGQVNNAFARVCDAGTNGELMRYDLSENASIATGMQMAKIYRHEGEWKFAALGIEFTGTWIDLTNSLK